MRFNIVRKQNDNATNKWPDRRLQMCQMFIRRKMG